MNGLLSDINNGTSLEKSINEFLLYVMPIASGLSIPLSLTNFAVFMKTGILNSPSNLIYFNLVIIDLLNSILGVTVSIDMWKDPDHRSRKHWGNRTTIQRVDSYVYIFTFDTNIFLVFGLALIRVLWLNMSALSVIRKLKLISRIVVCLAYVVGVECCLYAHFTKDLKKRKPYPDIWIELTDLLECAMILITITLSLYNLIRIRYHKSRINTTIYKSASRTSFVIVLNLTVSYSYYLVVNGARIYYVRTQGKKDICEKTDWGLNEVLLCDSLYIGVSFMCLNSLVNSIILLCEVRFRTFIFFYLVPTYNST